MKLGELHALLQEVDSAFIEVTDTKQAIKHGGCEHTMTWKRDNLINAEANLAKLLDMEIIL